MGRLTVSVLLLYENIYFANFKCKVVNNFNSGRSFMKKYARMPSEDADFPEVAVGTDVNHQVDALPNKRVETRSPLYKPQMTKKTIICLYTYSFFIPTKISSGIPSKPM